MELLGKNDAPGSWYPMYSYSDSIPTTSECGKVKNNLEAVKKRWLPQVIMADDFNAVLDQYMDKRLPGLLVVQTIGLRRTPCIRGIVKVYRFLP